MADIVHLCSRLESERDYCSFWENIGSLSGLEIIYDLVIVCATCAESQGIQRSQFSYRFFVDKMEASEFRGMIRESVIVDRSSLYVYIGDKSRVASSEWLTRYHLQVPSDIAISLERIRQKR